MDLPTQKLIKELLDICLRINIETEYCAFMRFYGHTSSIDIDIARSKEMHFDKIYNAHEYTTPRLFDTKDLQRIKTELLKFLPDDKN